MLLSVIKNYVKQMMYQDVADRIATVGDVVGHIQPNILLTKF